MTKIGDFIVDFLHFKAIFKKALTCVSGALGELFDGKNQRSKISCQGPFNDEIVTVVIYEKVFNS
jgi:hypothetical protein